MKPGMQLFSEQELDDLLGSEDYGAPASVSLRDGRVVAVRGILERRTGQAMQGRAGVQTTVATFSFPEHQCEDLAEGDGIRVVDVDYLVRSAKTDTHGITLVELRRAS